MEKRLKKRLQILAALVIALLVLIVLMNARNCESNEECFNRYASKCSRATANVVAQDNVFLYEVQGKKTEEGVKNCIVKVTLVRLEESATPNLKKALEGRGMLCHVPRTLLAETPLSHIENINDYCTGPLKEVLLQISLEKLYDVVVKNIGPLSLQYSQSLSEIDTTNPVSSVNGTR